MEEIKVLIIDDAVVVRKLNSNTIDAELGMKVVGIAPNGKLGLQRIPQVNPHIVVLDIEMPVMDGLETLEKIRADFGDLPVIMFSNLTARGAEVTIKALGMGATDYVTKPAKVKSLDEGIERIKTELIPKIREICRERLAPEDGFSVIRRAE